MREKFCSKYLSMPQLLFFKISLHRCRVSFLVPRRGRLTLIKLNLLASTQLFVQRQSREICFGLAKSNSYYRVYLSLYKEYIHIYIYTHFFLYAYRQSQTQGMQVAAGDLSYISVLSHIQTITLNINIAVCFAFILYASVYDTRVHIYIYIYICVYVCVCVCRLFFKLSPILL
jgi:hypothetical protein